MADVREATDSLLEEKPYLADSFRELVELDEKEPWSFDDTSLDSGDFGEIVSRGIVTEGDNGYRLADRDAVLAVLDGTEPPESTDESQLGGWSFPFQVPSVDRRTAAVLCGALLVVAFARIGLAYGSVFRNGDVVLAGNDPYGYLYWVEELLRTSSAFDFGAFSELPTRGYTRDTLTVVVLWWASALVGGAPDVAGRILAWYPPLVGVGSAFLVYLLSVRLTADRRIGIAAVLLLAITPAHAFRTMLGFADHHAFDYLWLSLTAYGLVVLAIQRRHHAGGGRLLRTT
ncbi:hypothetical protein Hrd1104_08820 [Halorhabdus sp. CBA1104]|uniref:STT3 domain-containing protein n=1 Tax=Halorhabdus sp. CBA1104 TaxID=1380432 RepID=UPI0012B28779|nr:STT3 domain-containing protein [Halorhabdus sp. CBA1104]QGN07398.1 hypothetical protein Hrd1104_08820 [Halorhabdus sp. CBA1104]